MQNHPQGTPGSRDAELDVRLRDDYLNVYFRGQSLARIVGRGRRPARLEIHHKYLVADRIGDFAGRQIGDRCAFDVDADFAESYVAHLSEIIERARCHVGPEESVELRLLQRNDSEAAPLVVQLSDRVEVEWFRPVPPWGEVGEWEIGSSGIGIMAAARVALRRRPQDAFIAVSIYARWMRAHPYAGKRPGLHADLSAHRILSDVQTFMDYADPS